MTDSLQPKPLEPRVRASLSATNTPAVKALAQKRITSNLLRLVMATRRTLESKVSEAGQQRVSPPIVTEVIHEMITRGELVRHANRHAELLSLPGTPRDAIKAREPQLSAALAMFHRYSEGSAGGEGVIGRAGEAMLEHAFLSSSTMNIVNWGDKQSQHLRGVFFDNPPDGIVIVDPPIQGLGSIEHFAIVEVKNRRDWVTPEDYKPWKLIRNAYKADVVGIYFSRRIMRSTFWLLFKRLGAVGVETFNQFAPPEAEIDLRAARDKAGLGYHDLYFKDDAPAHLQKQVDALPQRILAARHRMIEIRDVAVNYVDELADKSTNLLRRKSLLKALKADILAHDEPEEVDESAEDSDDDLYAGYDPSDEDGDAYRGR